MSKQVLIDNSNIINIISIRLENKEYRLQELEKLVKHNTLYEIELLYTKYSYNEFVQILNNFLILCLTTIVFEYSFDIKKINIARMATYYACDIYFPSYIAVYNYYGTSEDDVGIIKCTSRFKCTEAMTGKIFPHKYRPKSYCEYCRRVLTRFIPTLELHKEDNLEELSLMYKLVNYLVKS